MELYVKLLTFQEKSLKEKSMNYINELTSFEFWNEKHVKNTQQLPKLFKTLSNMCSEVFCVDLYLIRTNISEKCVTVI